MTEFHTILSGRETTIARDLNLNLQKIMESGVLEPKEASLALLAVSRAVGFESFSDLARARLANHGVPANEIQEAEESAALMGMLNTYYKFRSFLQNPDDYRTAGLRMTALARPSLGKITFEMMAFAVSVVNGCETCVVSHEAVLRTAGVSAEKIHDLARLAAVVRALKTMSEIAA